MPYLKTQSGINWFYEIKGKGEVILFIHGWSGDSNNWYVQTEYFNPSQKSPSFGSIDECILSSAREGASTFKPKGSTKNFCVITLDLPGHGQSSYRKIDFDDLAKEIFFICKKLKLKKINLIGASFGGMIAIQFAASYPSILKKLVLVDTNAKFINAGDFKVGMSENELKKMQKFMDTDFPNILIIFARSLFTEYERRLKNFPHIWRSIISQKALPQKEALKQFLIFLEKMDLRQDLAKIAIPTLIICGELDSICPVSGSIYLNKHINNSELKFFKNTGHLPFLTHSDKFNKIVEEFLIKK